MKVLRGLYKTHPAYRGLSHDNLSRSAWRLSGLDPIARQKAGEARHLARLHRREQVNAVTTAALSLAWVIMVWLALR